MVLTRDRHLAPRKAYGLYLVSSSDFREQLRDVLDEFSIKLSRDKIFTRCVECNSLLEEADKSEVKERVPGYVYDTQESFSVCPESGKVYWRGTHRELMEKVLASIGRGIGDK